MKVLCLVPEDCLNMQWLKRFQISLDICKFFHGFSLSPTQLHRQLFSGVRAPRWNDHDSPEEFNFASDILDYWAQMEEVRGHCDVAVGTRMAYNFPLL